MAKKEPLTLSEPKDPTTGHKWRGAVFPTDFQLFNFTELEDGARSLANLDDQWISVYPTLPKGVLAAEQEANQSTIDAWWSRRKVDIHHTIIPYVKNVMAVRLGKEAGILDNQQLDMVFRDALAPLSH